MTSEAVGINDARQAAGYSGLDPEPPLSVLESYACAMMLAGFASLAFPDYCRAKAARAAYCAPSCVRGTARSGRIGKLAPSHGWPDRLIERDVPPSLQP
jgi:hypothetical protein